VLVGVYGGGGNGNGGWNVPLVACSPGNYFLG
jgi:hypothetical protein